MDCFNEFCVSQTCWGFGIEVLRKSGGRFENKIILENKSSGGLEMVDKKNSKGSLNELFWPVGEDDLLKRRRRGYMV